MGPSLEKRLLLTLFLLILLSICSCTSLNRSEKGDSINEDQFTPLSMNSAAGLAPVPTPTPPTPPIEPLPPATKDMRRLPLRRNDSESTGIQKTTIRLLEEGEFVGGYTSDIPGEDDMMCVQNLDSNELKCICWVGPLDNAGVTGNVRLLMRKIRILEGNVEDAALMAIEDWHSPETESGNDQALCTPGQLAVSYDGGIFQPQPPK